MLQNDILAHASTVQSVNQAGQNFVASSDNKHVANIIRDKMEDVNKEVLAERAECQVGKEMIALRTGQHCHR